MRAVMCAVFVACVYTCPEPQRFESLKFESQKEKKGNFERQAFTLKFSKKASRDDREAFEKFLAGALEALGHEKATVVDRATKDDVTYQVTVRYTAGSKPIAKLQRLRFVAANVLEAEFSLPLPDSNKIAAAIGKAHNVLVEVYVSLDEAKKGKVGANADERGAKEKKRFFRLVAKPMV
ncbi:MAG: hypothetical protein HOO67_03905 [Candidatus Peribacteraceae bacterium]|nr:hypothetical protein [Candidatus Peribacteraceae bacterium]